MIEKDTPTEQQKEPQTETSKGVWLRRLGKPISLLLILGGLALIGVGVGIPLRDQLVLMANQPPPPPPPTEAVPSTTLTRSAGLSLADNPLPVVDGLAASAPTATPAPLPTATPAPLPTATPPPTQTNADSHSPVPTPTPALPPTLAPTPTPNPYPPAHSAPARIVAEAIGLDSPVVEAGWYQKTIDGQTVSVWDVVEYAAGWHKNSTLSGHTGNVVLSGHHNILGETFRYIVDLSPGDPITLYSDDRAYDYVVEDKFILKDKDEPEEVRQANARWIGPFDDQRLTLVTCWPYNNNTHRVVVVAKPKQ